MAFIILEGLDRAGKSTVAKLYEEKGYKNVHMIAPDKKYSSPGYTGPSYLDELVSMYSKYDGENVVFDRSIYGELVWSQVYNRKALLDEDDIEVLREFENRNETAYIYMYDQDMAAHWQRCVDNKEPLSRTQFKMASSLYGAILDKYKFTRKQLTDFVKLNEPPISSSAKVDELVKLEAETLNQADTFDNGLSAEQLKLMEANAINSILNKRILKQKGDIYDQLEYDIRRFLNVRLGGLFGKKDDLVFSGDEVQILKTYCSRIKDKLK